MKFRVNAVEYQMHIETANSYEYFEKSFWARPHKPLKTSEKYGIIEA